jgi:diamine N-acetyltransferase
VFPVAFNVDGHELALRALQPDDAVALGRYFDALSVETTRRFQPHELSTSSALRLCVDVASRADRFVLCHSYEIIGYFILSRRLPDSDIARYRQQGVLLDDAHDLSFAPSIADAWQNRRLASAAMPHLIAQARTIGARSLVLMGGTQATNERAVAFYEKFGFQRCGGYETDVYNHDMRLVVEGA